MRPSALSSVFLALLCIACQPELAGADTGRAARQEPGQDSRRNESPRAFSARDTSALVGLSGRAESSLKEALFHARIPGQTAELASLKLTGFTVRATTSGAWVRSHLSVEIENTESRQVEAVLRLPIPPGAAVTKSVLYVDDTPMTNAFVQHARARAIYDSIVSRRRDPLLAVWSGPDLLDITIFPVEGDGRRRFELEWVEPIGARDERLEYRLPMIAHRGRVVGKPERVTIDGTSYPNTAASVRVAHKGPKLVASRLPGDPFGYAMLRTGETAHARANAVIVADTSAAMNLDARRRQRADLGRLLADFPENSRISLVAADWLVTKLASAGKTSELRAVLEQLDDIPSAGALDLEQALRAAIDEAVAIGASTVVFVGHGHSRFYRAIPAEMLDRLQDEGISFHLVAGDSGVRGLKELAWLSGGLVLPDGRISLGQILRPDAPPAGAPGEIQRWYPLTSVTGELVWLGRFAGKIPAGATREQGADLRALWVRANLAADGDADQGAARSYQVLTPYTSMLVLEDEAAYRRFGLEVPEAGDEAQTLARGQSGAATLGQLSAGANSALAGENNLGLDDVTGGLMGTEVGEMQGGFGLGQPSGGAGGGGTGWGTIGAGRYGTIGHGSGTGSGYGLGRLSGRQARVPQVRLGNAQVNGSLDKNIIRRYIRRQLPRLRYCYEKELLRHPKLNGRVAARFTIGPQGQVLSARADGMRNTSVEQCIANVIQQVRFPKPAGGGTILVSYPFTFQAGDGSQATYVPPPSKWAIALKMLTENKSLKQIVKKSEAFAGAPRNASAQVLGWWLVENQLRRGYTPGEAYLLAARLLHRGGQHRDARRVLSESGYVLLSDAQALYRRWNKAADGKRLERLISGQ